MRTAAVLVLAAAAGCSQPAARPAHVASPFPDWSSAERRVGTVRHYGDTIQVKLPAETTRAEEFVVEVVTYGDGCVRRGDTVGMVTEDVAEIIPYDWAIPRSPAGPACTEELRRFVHRALIAFEEPGAALIRIRGRVEPGGTLLTTEREILVR